MVRVFYPNEYAVVAVPNCHFPIGTLVKVVGGSWDSAKQIETVICVVASRENEKRTFTSWQLTPVSD